MFRLVERRRRDPEVVGQRLGSHGARLTGVAAAPGGLDDFALAVRRRDASGDSLLQQVAALAGRRYMLHRSLRRRVGANDPAVMIGGDDACGHGATTYLGHMGPNAMYECEDCGGVLVRAT